MTAGAGQPYYDVCRDPWNSPAAGVSDEFSNPTVALKVKSAYNMATNNVGNCAVVFMPGNWDSGFNYVATLTASTDTIASYGTNAHADYTSLAALYNLYRIVSVGVKVFYVGAEAATGGLITLGAMPIFGNPTVTPGIGGSLPTTVGDWNDLPGTKSMACAAMTEPFCLAAHSFDRPSFLSLSDNLGGLTYFPSVLVGLTGGAVSTNCLRIEVTYNLELIPIMSSFASSQLSSVVPMDIPSSTRVRHLLPVSVGHGEAAVIAAKSPAVKRKFTGSRVAPTKRARATPLPMMANYRIRTAVPAYSTTYRRKKKTKFSRY